MMAETRIHPETGKQLKRDVRPMVVQYGSMAREVALPGWYNESDDDNSIHSGADLKAADEAFAELRTAYAAHVRDVRKSLKLNQEEAGEIIGGGRRAFQKYESGKAPPSDAAVGLIEVLAHKPEMLAILKAVRLAKGGPTKKGHSRRSGERLRA